MDNFRTRLTEDGAISIPPEYLQALGLRAGDEVILRLEDGAIQLFTIEQAIRPAQELVRSYIPEGRSLSDELIAERRQETGRE